MWQMQKIHGYVENATVQNRIIPVALIIGQQLLF